MRKGGAVARQMLIEAAAEPGVCPWTSAAPRQRHHPSPTGARRPTARWPRRPRAVPAGQVELKDPKDWKLIGQPVKRLDTVDKLTGKQVFGADLQLPGMLNAAIKACPVFGGKLESFDAAKVRDARGAQGGARRGHAVAVVADTWWQAKTALDALPITWDKGPMPSVSSASIEQMLDEGLTPTRPSSATRRRCEAALAGRAKTVEAVYATRSRTTPPWSR